jgi:hypothetical protein
MVSPYDQRKAYVNSAVAIHPIEVPCKLFKEKKDFWEVAAYIGELWEEIKNKKQMAKTVESDAGTFIQNWGKRKWVFILQIICEYNTDFFSAPIQPAHQPNLAHALTSYLIHPDLTCSVPLTPSPSFKTSHLCWIRTN